MSKIYLLFIFINLLVNECFAIKRKAQGKIQYEFNFSGEYGGCADQGDNIFNYTKINVKKDSPTTTIMDGAFDFNKQITFGTKVEYKAFKLTETGKELAWTMELPDFCEAVPQVNMPWSAAIDLMHLNPRSCPIPAGIYEIDPPLKINMEIMKSTLSKEDVGEYEVLVEINTMKGFPPKNHLLTCFTCGYVIEEIREQVD